MSQIHTEPHPLAGKKVRIKEGVEDPAQKMVVGGAEYVVEDWWDKLTGKSWMISDGNFAAMHYAMRTGLTGSPVPLDNEVVYGHIGNLGHLVHVEELAEVIE